MDRIEYMKENLMNAVESQLNNLASANAEELGAAVDMIKDLEEASYYCTITKAMNEKEKYHSGNNGNNDMMYYYERDMDRPYYNRMYYGNSNSGRNSNNSGNSNGSRNYMEGRSGTSRRNYMESKYTNNDKHRNMQNLEQYIHELSEDITEMIEDASSEEKRMLQRKLNILANKIYNGSDNNNMNNGSQQQ